MLCQCERRAQRILKRTPSKHRFERTACQPKNVPLRGDRRRRSKKKHYFPNRTETEMICQQYFQFPTMLLVLETYTSYTFPKTSFLISKNPENHLSHLGKQRKSCGPFAHIIPIEIRRNICILQKTFIVEINRVRCVFANEQQRKKKGWKHRASCAHAVIGCCEKKKKRPAVYLNIHTYKRNAIEISNQ